MAKNPRLTAKWIWKKQASYNPYQQVVVAQKLVRLGRVERAEMRITTDGWYRLLVNGQWANDGPCRSWPEHFQYDVIDISAYLEEGDNELLVIARHWSVGTFHTVPRQAGLLVQLDLTMADGKSRRIVSDGSWLVAEAPAWVAETPKVSIQMEPQELYDARLEDELFFEPAEVLFPAGGGPWQDLHERDSALLTRKPLPFRTFLGANLVRRNRSLDFCVPTSRLANPGVIEANRSVGNAGGMAARLELAQPAEVKIQGEGFSAAIDGQVVSTGAVSLTAGSHFVLAFSYQLFGHDKDRSLRLIDPPDGLSLVNPLQPDHENPWCWVDLPDFAFRSDDLSWPMNLGLDGDREKLEACYLEEIQRLLNAVKDVSGFKGTLGGQARCLDRQEMFTLDSHAPFLARQVIGSAAGLVSKPSALMYDNSEVTVVTPSPDGDIELVYDLGEQSIGYYDLDLIAEVGVEIDLFGVEFITSRGIIQQSWGNRNGMRYITREGTNTFTSLKRRSQRYLFITLRKQSKPVRIRKIQLIESTYPVDQAGTFDCSDARLGRIYEISARTLKLCMEDTFTDCPLFEQTHWVGDARNESLFNYSTFGAADLARRCIRLTAQSLERYPLAGCQLPSGWDCLLPAWSFLWGISVWDYYQYSGDLALLKEIWPAVVRNLKGAEGLLDEKGLFSGPFWNMFDWSGIDDRHEMVLHNSMFLIGAIDAAQKIADVLHKVQEGRWLVDFRWSLKLSINALWDPQRQAYPDSIHRDGTLSLSMSVHTSFLSVLYDIVQPENYAAVMRNLLQPPDGMVRVGSPFAILYLYEALEKAGKTDEILKSIYENYLPMLEEGATTVWEVFSTSKDRPSGFPTRSHCHAWSSAPLHYLPRVVLGIRQVEPGGAAYEVSPRPNGLSWARGAVASPKGAVNVEWKLEGQTLRIHARAPEGAALHFVSNESLAGLEIEKDF